MLSLETVNLLNIDRDCAVGLEIIVVEFHVGHIIEAMMSNKFMEASD